MSDVIEYDQLAAFLKNASLFETYRLSVAIQNELDNPERIEAVRKKFKEGDVIEYFLEETNTLVCAKVLKKKRKYVSVQNVGDEKRWKIPYYMININSREFNFNTPGKGLDKNSAKVGDSVGFNNDGEEVVGCIERLNPKTVSILTTKGQRWRVAYALLYTVIDGETQAVPAIDGQVLLG